MQRELQVNPRDPSQERDVQYHQLQCMHPFEDAAYFDENCACQSFKLHVICVAALGCAT